MTVQDISSVIEAIAPRSYQESYDNAGLITGNAHWEVSGVLICLDSTEAVIDEAIALGCNVVVAHHPILFNGLKRLTGNTYVERTLIKAIKNDVAIYAAHTNLDNVADGVNYLIARKLGLMHTRILQPKAGILKKLYTYVPANHIEHVKKALFESGAGVISDYEQCSFSTHGTGTFKGNIQTKPFIGTAGVETKVEEWKLEVLFMSHLQTKVLKALLESHPYEEVAYEIIGLDNLHQNTGSGMVGTLPIPVPFNAFLSSVKQIFKAGVIRYTPPAQQTVQTIAVCGGAGHFLLKEAIACAADVFISSDFKYHEFFDADGCLSIMDVGHYESEQYTSELIAEIIQKKFPNFAPLISKINTNPVNYF